MMLTQPELKELFSGACYAMCIAYIAGVDDIPSAVLQGVYKGYIEKDGYVRDPVAFYNMLNPSKKCDMVDKPLYGAIVLAPDKPTIVRYTYNGNSHFVVVKDYEVIYDPWGKSKTVELGKPVDLRCF